MIWNVKMYMDKLLLIMSLLLVLGCTQQTIEASNNKTPTELCIEACREALSQGEDLSNGPCLSNEIASDWVCDVAHKPRQDSNK